MYSEVYWGTTMLRYCLSYKEEKHAVSALMDLRKNAEETSHLISNRTLEPTRGFEGTKGQKNKAKRSGSID